MACPVRVIAPRKRVRQVASHSIGLEGGKTVRQPDGVFSGKPADLGGVLRNEAFVHARIRRCLRHVRRRGEQDHAGSRRKPQPDHARPRRMGGFKADAAVVQSIVDHDDVRPVAEHLLLEARRALLRVLAADRRHDHVDHGIRETVLQADVEQVRIGIQAVDHGRCKIPGRDAVPVAYDVDSPILGPMCFENLRDTAKIG